jgi:citrate lyase subunit beta/citryl-CoA lyase
MMFVPGNNPGMLQNAGIYGADALIFDLEDSVSINEKDSARELVFQAISNIKYPSEIAIRINHIRTPFGRPDLAKILAAKPNLIRLPMTESAVEIQTVDAIITEAENRYKFAPGSILMMAAVETAKGLLKAYEIASASPRMVALAIGGEDFVADLHTSRSKHGRELFVARSEILLAARAAGINAIDTVFSDVNDTEGFINEATAIKEMGFDGKSVVNPRQIQMVHDIFTPTAKEIDHAKKVLVAYEEALARKSGVISLNGKMIDLPIVARAERTLAYADAVGVGAGRIEA